jgi:hypothetical protein
VVELTAATVSVVSIELFVGNGEACEDGRPVVIDPLAGPGLVDDAVILPLTKPEVTCPPLAEMFDEIVCWLIWEVMDPGMRSTVPDAVCVRFPLWEPEAFNVGEGDVPEVRTSVVPLEVMGKGATAEPPETDPKKELVADGKPAVTFALVDVPVMLRVALALNIVWVDGTEVALKLKGAAVAFVPPVEVAWTPVPFALLGLKGNGAGGPLSGRIVSAWPVLDAGADVALRPAEPTGETEPVGKKIVRPLLAIGNPEPVGLFVLLYVKGYGGFVPVPDRVAGFTVPLPWAGPNVLVEFGEEPRVPE